MSTAPAESRYKLVFTVPHASLEACKSAIFAKGAGSYPGGKYSLVCFQTPGQGQFLPGDGASPHIGEPGRLETTEEMKVETLCVSRQVMLAAVDALKNSHPYEEPAYEVYKIEDV